MNKIYKIIVIILIFYVQQSKNKKIDLMKFPYGFSIGTVSSTYKVEGAWNFSGDVNADVNYNYKEDVKLIKDIGFDFYRFSMSWTKILPTGYVDFIDEKKIKYYNDLLDELEKLNIQPIVTIYEWNHPKIFETFGGWRNERMAYLFADYARIIFEKFGERVKVFTTINEPLIFCRHRNSYLDERSVYHCIHNMLKAHALAYRIYDREFRSIQKGKIGFALSCRHYYNKNQFDFASSQIAFEFQCGHFLNPIFSKKGDYSPVVKRRVVLRSLIQGYKKSRLPSFSKEWIQFIKGTADYLGLNHYTSNMVEPIPSHQILQWPNDGGFNYSMHPDWFETSSSQIRIVPEGFGDILRKLKNQYSNPVVYVLENGMPDRGSTEDDSRVCHLYMYMKEMLSAIKHDGCNVHMYTVRNFIDEWPENTVRFGIVQVHYENGYRKLMPKKSALWLKAVLKRRRLIAPNCTHLHYWET